MTNYQFPTIEELLEAGVHFGHAVNKWNPKMEPYIYTAKQGVHIIDLDQTQKMLKDAGEFLFDIAARGGQIIFVCTKKQVAQLAKDQALRCGAMYMNERWMGGTITNYKIIKKSIDKLVSLKKKRDTGELAMYTKKERLLIDRQIDKLEKFFGGVVELKGVPQAVVVVDARRERTAINECLIYDVPVVALIDTNSDPSAICKLIPGNDDAAKSVGRILTVLADCIATGYAEFAKPKEVKPQETAKQVDAGTEAPALPTETPKEGSEAPKVAKKSAKKKPVTKKAVKVVKKTTTKKVKKEEK
ncbi:MAG: 30S ribosomal protein S2 [bacterium]